MGLGVVDIEQPTDKVLNNVFLDMLHSKYLAKKDGIDPEVWRWTPARIEDFLQGNEEYLNLGDVLRDSVTEDICAFFNNTDPNDPWSRRFQDAILCEGIGSGKSFKISIMATYFVHLMLCLRNPQKFFNCADSSKLAIMNMCFAGDQKVRLTDGALVDFKSLFESQEEIEVSAYNLETKAFELVMAKPCVEAGSKKIKKITFSNGRVLRLSDTHPLLTYKKAKGGKKVPEWRAVKDLQCGVPVKVGQFIGNGKPSGLTSDEIKLLAYVLGDCRATHSGIQFLSIYKRVVEDIKALATKFGCNNPKECEKGDLQCVTVSSPQIEEFLKKFGLIAEIDEKRDVKGVAVATGRKIRVLLKTMPEAIVGADETEVLLFLNRLWSSYGSVGFGHKVTMTFTAPSEEFIQDVADMLSRFGIITRHYQATGKYQKYRNAKVWRIGVSDVKSKEVFLERIGRYGLDIEGFYMFEGNVGDSFHWSNIEKIENDGEEMTYDIEVPKLNNLVVNGMVCHNSVSASNASKVIFSEIKYKIDNCKWFQDRPWGRPDARVPDPMCLSELRFKNNIFIIPGSSNWRSAVGYNIIVGIIDEAGNYRATDNSDQAEDIYNTMKRRLGSRFENMGACIVAGSPMYESDFLEKKISEAEESRPNTYVKRRTLWESKYGDWEGEVFYVDKVNRIMYDTLPEEAKLEDFDAIPKVQFLYEAFRQNVTKAYRDFGARPSVSIDTFFEMPKLILDRVDTTREDPIDKHGRFKEWFKPIDKYAFHSVHVDIGLTGDALGFALGHYDGKTPEGGIKTYIDLMVRMQGNPKEPIQISSVRELIYSLTAIGFNIKLITFDGFQSTDCMQILRQKRYNVEYLSVDKGLLPYNNLKASINEGRVNYYRVPSGKPEEPSASEVFVRETMQLEEIQGKKVDHPPKGSKDVADAVCGVNHNLVENHNKYGRVTAKIVRG